MSTELPPCAPPSFDILDHVASPVFVLEAQADSVPRYVAFNANARAISGQPLNYYLGKTALEVYPEAYGRTAYARHCEAVTSGRAMTYELELPLGEQNRTIRTTLIPIRSSVDSITHLYGTSEDLTKVRDTREAQVSFNTIATEMEEFIAMAAHDLRAPMSNMATIAELLGDGFVDHGDGKLELIEMIDEVAQKSMHLIADVLEHARALDTVDHMSKFNFAALCRDICDVLDPQCRHSFTYTSAEILADRTAMQIGIRNVIDNAIKHGDRDRLNIDIALHRGMHGMLNVIMTDDGQGFHDSALAFLNGGEFRVDSGYGLLGVRRMVQARGGAMTAENIATWTGGLISFSLPGQWVGRTNSLGDLLSDWGVSSPVSDAKIA